MCVDFALCCYQMSESKVLTVSSAGNQNWLEAFNRLPDNARDAGTLLNFKINVETPSIEFRAFMDRIVQEPEYKVMTVADLKKDPVISGYMTHLKSMQDAETAEQRKKTADAEHHIAAQNLETARMVRELADLVFSPSLSWAVLSRSDRRNTRRSTNEAARNQAKLVSVPAMHISPSAYFARSGCTKANEITIDMAVIGKPPLQMKFKKVIPLGNPKSAKPD